MPNPGDEWAAGEVPECPTDWISEVEKLEARLEAIAEFRAMLEPLVNDGDRHDMGGPFIDGHWVLSALDSALAGKTDEDGPKGG